MQLILLVVIMIFLSRMVNDASSCNSYDAIREEKVYPISENIEVPVQSSYF
jgi:hypothetical protein